MTDQAKLELDEGFMDAIETVEAHSQAAGIVKPADGALDGPALAAQAAAGGVLRLAKRGVMPRRRSSSRWGCEQ